MPSLRTQVAGEGDSKVVDVEDGRLTETAAKEIKQQSAEPPQKRVPLVLGLAVALASLWAGAASAYLAGYFRAQGATGFWDYQLIGFAVIMAFLPPLLFIAAAFTLTRAQSMTETALRLASVSEHLTAADDNAGQTAQRLGRTVRRELDALSTGIDGVFGRLRALETALEDRVAQLEDASARAGVKAETIAQRLQSERESIENLANRLDDVSARATETLAGRAAQLKAMIESAGGEIRSAGQILETHAGQFRESVELAAAAPRDMALELDRQAKQIENAADTAVARAEFVLARQERQRAAMTELIVHLKEDGKTFDATVEAHCAAAAQAAALLTTEAKHLDEIADQGLRRIDAAMANAESRTTQLAGSFGREAERVKETADSAANAVARVVEGLRDAAESARALIADSTDDAQRRSKDFVGEAMSQCDQLLRAAASVAEQAEKARSILAKAAGDAERHIVGLPGIAAQEAARVREAMRAETEQLLDMSARTLATLQTRAQKRPPAAASEEAPAPSAEQQQPQTELTDGIGEGLRGLARRITAPKRRPEERPKANYELSDVLAAAGRSDAAAAKGGGKTGSSVDLGTLQTALAELAVDLEELSHDSSDPALWRRWLDGDRAVFARQLAASIGPQSVDRVAALYRDNSRFHDAADTYLAEFEAMLNRSRETDHDGLLASSLLTADTGKIYLAIAYALGRLE